MNDPLKLINKTKNLQQVNGSRQAPQRLSYVKLQMLLKKNLFGPTRVARNQTAKRTQIKNNKTLPIKQQRDWEGNRGLYFKLGKDACISSNSKAWNNVFCKTFTRKILDGVHQKADYLKMAKFENTSEIFSLLRIFVFFTWTGYL